MHECKIFPDRKKDDIFYCLHKVPKNTCFNVTQNINIEEFTLLNFNFLFEQIVLPSLIAMDTKMARNWTHRILSEILKNKNIWYVYSEEITQYVCSMHTSKINPNWENRYLSRK